MSVELLWSPGLKEILVNLDYSILLHMGARKAKLLLLKRISFIISAEIQQTCDENKT